MSEDDLAALDKEIDEAFDTMRIDQIYIWAAARASELALQAPRNGKKYDRKWATQIDRLRMIQETAADLSTL